MFYPTNSSGHGNRFKLFTKFEIDQQQLDSRDGGMEGKLHNQNGKKVW